MNNLSLPEPKKLAEKFSKEVWEEYGNASYPALIDAWASLFETFNQCIRDNTEGVRPVKKKVIPLPTGSGKSQAMRYYLRKLEGYSAIVITFFKEEVKATSEAINEDHYYKSVLYDSDSNVSDDGIKKSQIVVTTHAQYLKALKDPNWLDVLSMYKGKSRDLYIIDESLNQVDSIDILFSDISDLVNKITILLDQPKQLNEQQIKSLKIEKDNLLEIRNLLESKDNSQEGILLSESETKLVKEKLKSLPNLKSLISKDSRFDFRYLAKKSDLEKTNSILKRNELFQKGEIFYIASVWNDENNRYEKAIISPTILKSDTHHSVILDATANSEYVYKISPEAEILRTNKKIKSYKNVNLYFSKKPYNIGKTSLDKASKADLAEHISELIFNTNKKNYYLLKTQSLKTKSY